MAYPRALWQSAHLPLLQSKIQAPRRPPVTVRRQRLLERLEAAPEVKLTLISAPAGYGKSTLLRNWEQRQKQPVAWLTLDPEDNNTSRFARYLHATWISQVTTGTEENAQQEVGGSPPPLDQLLPRLLNRLEETSEPVTFLFDDVHHLESPAVLGGISFLVDNIPTHARVIIASRADPAIGLGRLRAHGWVNEIRSHDLRFNEKELAEFFEIQLGRSLPASDLVTLMERTEGWPAGLQLVAHLLKGQHDLTEIIKDFHGDHPYLFDYLAGEVLQGLDQDVKAFLLESSILPKLDTALCDEVLQRRNSGAMLEQLRAENLFLEPTEPSQSSFRFHPLFREHLQLRLSNKLDAAGQQQLHRRACRSLRSRGLPQLAIPHAVASGDLQAAVDLISDQSQQAMNVGDSASIKRWISWLPEQVIVDTPQLAIWHAWSLTVSGQLQEVEYWLESAESHPGYAGSSVPSAEEIQFHASTIRSTLSRFRGNTDRTIKESAHSLQLIPEDRPILRAIAQLNQGHARLLQGKVEAAVPLLEEAFHLADSAGHRYVALSAQYQLGKCHLAMGELDQAELTFKTADQATLAHGKEGLRCVYHLGMALLDLERHELDYAE